MIASELKALCDTYLAVGAGALCLIVLIWVVIYVVTLIYKKLSEVKEEQAGSKVVIENCTEAIRELSRSNDNVASALKLLDSSVGQTARVMDKLATVSIETREEVLRIREAVRRCEKSNEKLPSSVSKT